MPVRTDSSVAVFRGHKVCAVCMTSAMNRNPLRDSPQLVAVSEFALFALVMLTTVMMKTAPAMMTDASGRLAGARILVMEKCFEALVDQMVEDGSEPANAAVVMLEHLADRFARRRAS